MVYEIQDLINNLIDKSNNGQKYILIDMINESDIREQYYEYTQNLDGSDELKEKLFIEMIEEEGSIMTVENFLYYEIGNTIAGWVNNNLEKFCNEYNESE